ncbi:hypothetical protein A2524_00220 [Candidatus Wolfebacteria bacterium RIFOXYD12_FULL_48_21]|nr:MAG: hypothetical protein A2524_00220 [Candidatus Wolfebacteria bacterium RIFOXYD12_FULL_48_21]OGM97113.1 MAG: hypothetical protein A2532_02990 [Candidatus Wolfebacteria bacterium RIFOXYD2_FULL_48_11]
MRIAKIYHSGIGRNPLFPTFLVKVGQKSRANKNDGMGLKISYENPNSLLRAAQTTGFLRKFFAPILSGIFTGSH